MNSVNRFFSHPTFRAPRRIVLGPIVLTSMGLAASTFPARAQAPSVPTETPDQWIALATRVHGGFGSYLPLGIRIGLDAHQKLKAGPRDLDVTYFDGPNTPCACVADGLMLSTGATLGQGSLHLAPTKSAASTFGVALIRHKTTGQTLRYVIPASTRISLDWLNAHTNERGRFDRVMALPSQRLFQVQTIAASPTSNAVASTSQHPHH